MKLLLTLLLVIPFTVKSQEIEIGYKSLEASSVLIASVGVASVIRTLPENNIPFYVGTRVFGHALALHIGRKAYKANKKVGIAYIVGINVFMIAASYVDYKASQRYLNR